MANVQNNWVPGVPNKSYTTDAPAKTNTPAVENPTITASEALKKAKSAQTVKVDSKKMAATSVENKRLSQSFNELADRAVIGIRNSKLLRSTGKALKRASVSLYKKTKALANEIFSKTAKKNVKFDPTVKIFTNRKVQIGNKNGREEINFFTNFSDRRAGASEIKKFGVSARNPIETPGTPNDSAEVPRFKEMREHVTEHITEQGGEYNATLHSSVVSFKDLTSVEDVDYNQLSHASANILDDALGNNARFAFAKHGKTFIVGLLDSLVQSLPNKEIQTLEDLKQALLNKIKEKQKDEDWVDKETFLDLVAPGFQPLTQDVVQSPEFVLYKEVNSKLKGSGLDKAKEAVNIFFDQHAAKDGDNAGEVKISFVNISDENMDKFSKAVDHLFADPDAQAVLNKFLK